MENTEKKYILIRTTRTNEQGERILVEVKIVERADADLTGYSFLRSLDEYDEWVPTSELDLYKRLFYVCD